MPFRGWARFPVDVRGPHSMPWRPTGISGCWGPEGCGILFVSQELQDSVRPVEFGWTNVAGYADYASRDMTLRPDAGRYECGTLNTIGCYGLRAAIEFLLEVGIARPSARRSRSWAIWSPKASRPRDTKCSAAVRVRTGAGIVSFRKPGVEACEIVQKLKAARIVVAPRQSWVRVSPHFYISPDDIGRMLEALP